MPEADEYKDCCRRSATESDTAFCPECGHAFYRCAYPGCRSLINPLGHCPFCVRPELYVEKGAVLVAEKDECLTIPFVLTNTSPVNHALSVHDLFRYGKDVKNEPVPIGWEKLEAGRERTFSVQTEPFTGSGTIHLGLRVVVSSRVEEIEELYVFAGEMRIDVERGSVEPAHISQTFNMGGANLGTGALVYATQKQTETGFKKRQAIALQTRLSIPLERQDRYERENGHRGYKDSGTRIPRSVEFVYDGFPENDKPFNGPLCGQQPVIRCGRNSRRFDAQRNPKPNDLCLRIYDPKSGKLDAEGSAAISRHACDFIIQNDRLYVRALSDTALIKNGAALKEGDLVVVNHGDLFATPAKSAVTISFGTKFWITGDEVRQIRFEMGKNPVH
jgi:hypothetical protein